MYIYNKHNKIYVFFLLLFLLASNSFKCINAELPVVSAKKEVQAQQITKISESEISSEDLAEILKNTFISKVIKDNLKNLNTYPAIAKVMVLFTIFFFSFFIRNIPHLLLSHCHILYYIHNKDGKK